MERQRVFSFAIYFQMLYSHCMCYVMFLCLFFSKLRAMCHYSSLTDDILACLLQCDSNLKSTTVVIMNENVPDFCSTFVLKSNVQSAKKLSGHPNEKIEFHIST